MDNNKLIIGILIVIIVILAVGIFAINNTTAKEDTKLTIMSNSTINAGDSIKIKLTDFNNAPISNQTVNITIMEGNKTSSYYSVVTNEEGVGTLKIDKDHGNYTINCTYGGNSKYAGSNSVKNITIEEDSEVSQTQESVSSTQQSSSTKNPSGLTDAEIDAYIQRDLSEREKNGVTSDYDYEEAREFYSTVPPTGMK